MAKRGVFTKVLAVIGTVLVGLPILAPLLFGFASLFMDGVYRFDFLMPAELFFLVLGGSGLLLWAAIRARSQLKLIALSFIAGIVLLGGGLALAQVTGLASGAIEPDGWQSTLTLAMILAFDVAVVCTFIGGILLLRDLIKPQPVLA